MTSDMWKKLLKHIYGGTVMAFYSYQHSQLTCHLHVHTLCADLTTCKLLAAYHSQIIHSTNHIRAGGPGDNSIPQQMVICQNCANWISYRMKSNRHHSGLILTIWRLHSIIHIYLHVPNNVYIHVHIKIIFQHIHNKSHNSSRLTLDHIFG